MLKSSLTLSPGLDSMLTESPAFFREEDNYLNTDIEVTAYFFSSAAPHPPLTISLKKFSQESLMFQALSYGDD